MRTNNHKGGQVAFLEPPSATRMSRPEVSAWRLNQSESTKPAMLFRPYAIPKLPERTVVVLKIPQLPELMSNSVQLIGVPEILLQQAASRASDEWVPSFLRRLDTFANLETGWDSYEAPPPNASARFAARQAILTLGQGVGCRPVRIAPSVEGGVAISWRQNNKNANIEFFNSGEVYAALSDSAGEPRIREVRDGELEPTLVWISDYFQR